MDKDFTRQFNKCPCCDSEDRFLEQLGEELKEKGWAKEDWTFHMDVRQGTVLEPSRMHTIPIGSSVPGFGFMTDICMDCGCIYAVDITRNDAVKPAPPIQQPNRAQRRRDERESPPTVFRAN